MKHIKIWLMLFCMNFTGLCFAELNVVYPNVNESGSELFGYAALELALKNSGEDFNLSIRNERMNNARIRAFIKTGEISISDFGTSPEFEDELLPIYFPIDLGLNGWRVFIIHRSEQQKFSQLKDLYDLKQLRAGQGVGWSDTAILRHSNLEVIETPYLVNLFRMIERKRFDYLPLGANEVHSLLSVYKESGPNLVVEETALLIYPFARLFFVQKHNTELRDAVLRGLINSFENGSFWRLFKTHPSNQALFAKANLKTRHQIRIDNPFMTEAFNKIPKKYFFTLKMLSN